MAGSGFLVVASGLAGAALAFVGERINEARRERNARLFRNQEERRKTGADYLVALEAYRRAVIDQRDKKLDESEVCTREIVLSGTGDFEQELQEAKRQRNALVSAMRRQLGEPDD